MPVEEERLVILATEGGQFPFLWVIAAVVGSFVAVLMVMGYKKELFVRK